MLRFVLRRAGSALLVMFSLSVLVFLIFFATPGTDPAARIAGKNASQQTLREVRRDFGLDKPMPVQYALMMKKLFITRDLMSFVNRGAKVIPQVVEAAPMTFSLVLGASVLWVTFAIGLGLVAAVYRGRTLDAVVMIVGLIGISMPVFWLGEVVNLFTQSRWHDTFLLVGAAARLRAVHGVARRLVQGAAAAVADAVRPLHRAVRARAALVRSSRRRRRTTCGRRAPRA